MVSFVFYGVLGVAKESARKPGSLWMYNVQDIADGTLKTRAFCVVCEVFVFFMLWKIIIAD